MILEHFFKYMPAYSFVFPDSQIASYWGDLKRNLAEILEGIPIYELELPSKYDLSVFSEVYRLMTERDENQVNNLPILPEV